MEKKNNPFYEGGDSPPIRDSSDTVPLTAERFFGDNGHSGYFTREQFVEYGKSLRDKEVQDLSTTVSLMNLGLTMGGNLQKRTDRGGRIYVHPDFYKSKARVGVKLVLEHGMEGFITDYQEGYISIQFTLEELIAEAKKQK